MSMKRREFLAAGLGLHVASVVALAQQGGATPDRTGGGRGAVPTRSATTTSCVRVGLYPVHPGWKGMESPHTGDIFSIEIV